MASVSGLVFLAMKAWSVVRLMLGTASIRTSPPRWTAPDYVKSLPKDIETSDPSRRAAYLRSDLFERRRKLMADWSTDG